LPRWPKTIRWNGWRAPIRRWRHLNYEGVFVHEHAGETETLRVIHRVGSDGVSERLLSMDRLGPRVSSARAAS